MGGAGARRVARQITEIGQKIGQAGGNPSAELQAQFKEAQDKLFKYSRWTTYVVLLALLCMASARYL
jgi:hypothetical protein